MTNALTAPRFVVIAMLDDVDRGVMNYCRVDCARTFRHASVIAARREYLQLDDGCKIFDTSTGRDVYADPDAPLPPTSMEFDEIPF